MTAVAGIGRTIPVVLLQADQPGSPPGLSVDNELGGVIAARHLMGLGHRRVAMLAGPQDWSEAHARQRGFEAALSESGLTPVTVVEGDWSAESGYEAFRELARHDVSGVFCANDQMALGLIHGAFDRGISVPRDLSVVGFDDVPESAHYLPPLTTIKQDFAVLGRRSLHSLVSQVEGTEMIFDVPVRPSLVVRASTRPAP